MQFHIPSFEGPGSYWRAGGIACTGGTGEEYALPSYDALVLELLPRLEALPERPLGILP